MAQLHLLPVGEQAGLNDDLQEPALAGCFDLPDLLLHQVISAVLHPPQVNDHVHLVCPILHGVCRHKALGFCGVIAIGEANHGANSQTVSHIFLRLPDIGGRNADGSCLVVHTVITNGLDFPPGRCLRQKGVIAFRENFLHIH